MINTVTLNPAFDKMFFLSELRKNITNRVQCVQETIGGKGTHVSINLKLLEENSRAFGICHGHTGKKIIAALDAHGLEVHFLWRSEGDSRTNYLIVEDSCDCTMIAERGVPLTDADIDEMEDRIAMEVGQDDYLVLSGDTSNCAPTVYGRIMRRLEKKNVRVFLDTSGEALLDSIRHRPYLVKPNLDELSMLCGRPVANTLEDVLAVIDSLDAYGVEVIAVSMGGEGSVVRAPDGVYHACPPAAEVVNTIGCGDCYLAAVTHGLYYGKPIEEVLRVASGTSAATAESPGSVGFDPVRARELAKRTLIRKIR